MSSYPRLLIFVLLCSCSAAKPTGPQPAGVTSRAFVGDAEIEVRYRYEPKVGKEIVFYVDTIGRTGSAGAVRLALELDGFTVVSGKPSWEVNVAATKTATHELTLRAVQKNATVTVVTEHVERGARLATDSMRFWLDEEGTVIECQAEHEACQ